MSLILEALKKLEREKPGPERGVVVLASAARATGRASRPSHVVPVAAAVTVLLTGTVGWWALSRPPVAPATAVLPAPVMAAETAPPPIELTAPPAVGVSRSSSPRVLAPVDRPLAPAATPAPVKLPAFVLSAIGSRDGHAVAVINDEVVQVGDLVKGARVVEIGTAHVEIEIDGERRRLVF